MIVRNLIRTDARASGVVRGALAASVADLQDRTFDPAAPEMLLYNGNSPSSKLVGVSYAMFGDQPGPNDGFVGPNDEWHEHPSLCVLGAFVVGPDHTPDELCESIGGFKLRGNSLWMSHLWQVPGWESQWGLFSGENSSINMATSDLMQPRRPDPKTFVAISTSRPGTWATNVRS